MSVQYVVARIEEAFPELPLPDMTLRQAQLADETMSREISQEEWDATGRIDHAVVWKDIEPAVLIACDAALSHIVVRCKRPEQLLLKGDCGLTSLGPHSHASKKRPTCQVGLAMIRPTLMFQKPAEFVPPQISSAYAAPVEQDVRPCWSEAPGTS
jgi:hypothetical protein